MYAIIQVFVLRAHGIIVQDLYTMNPNPERDSFKGKLKCFLEEADIHSEKGIEHLLHYLVYELGTYSFEDFRELQIEDLQEDKSG